MEKTLKINLRGVVNLHLEELNAFQEDIKELPEENYMKLREEILQDGFSFSPHVFQDGDGAWWLLDGHQRRTCLTRMKEEGFEIPTIPCMEVEAESLEHARRLVLAGTSQFGVFSTKKLVAFSLKTGIEPRQQLERFVLPTVKFEKLVNVSGHQRHLGGEEPEPLPKEPITQVGQIWQLGRHRLLCGNSANIADVAKLTGDQVPEIAFTSPPYNAAIAMVTPPKNGSKSKSMRFYDGNYLDNLPNEEYVAAMQKILGMTIDRVKNFVFWNVNYCGNTRSSFLEQIVPFLPKLQETICWKKTSAMPVPHGLTRKWEPIFIFRCPTAPVHVYEGGAETNFWEVINNNLSMENHRAAFPVALPEKALELTKAESVYDPFGGTGTTLVAAERLNRTCFMMEISPLFCDSIIARWEKMTGEKASLAD